MKLIREYRITNALGYSLLKFPTARYTRDQVLAFYYSVASDKVTGPFGPIKIVAINALGEQYEIAPEDL